MIVYNLHALCRKPPSRCARKQGRDLHHIHTCVTTNLTSRNLCVSVSVPGVSQHRATIVSFRAHLCVYVLCFECHKGMHAQNWDVITFGFPFRTFTCSYARTFATCERASARHRVQAYARNFTNVCSGNIEHSRDQCMTEWEDWGILLAEDDGVTTEWMALWVVVV